MPNPARVGNLCHSMASAGVDAVLLTTPPNLYYFSGFRTTLYTRFNGLLVLASGTTVLVTSYVDEQLAKQEIWGPVQADQIRIHGPISRPDVFQAPLDALKPELSDVRKLGVDGISLTLFRELGAAFPNLDIEEITQDINEIRRIKDAREVENLERASRIAIECMNEARGFLSRSGLTESELAADLERLARRRGADGFGYPILVSAGEKIAAPHSPPLPLQIPDDAPFVRIAFAPTFDGYCSSLIRTFSRQTSPMMARFAKAFFAAMSDIEVMLRPGVSVQDILSTVGRSYEQSGVGEFWGGDMGYSLGVAVQEPPRIGGRDRTVIEAGMVLAIMPGLRKPGDATFHHSDVYVVTEGGCRCLSEGLQELVGYQ